MGFCPFNLLVIWYFFYQRCGAILIVVFFDLSYLDTKKYENKEIRIHTTVIPYSGKLRQCHFFWCLNAYIRVLNFHSQLWYSFMKMYLHFVPSK